MGIFRRRRGKPEHDDRAARAQRGRQLLEAAQDADERWDSSGDVAALILAAHTWVEVADLLPAPSSERADALNEAAGRLLRHYDSTEEEHSLALSRQLLTDAVTQSSPDQRGIHLSNLGAVWRTTYERTEDPADLRRSLEANEQALAVTPAGAAHPPGIMANLATTLRETYHLDADPAVLDRAVALDEQALDAAPPGDPDRLALLNGLANGLSLRLARRRDRGDVDRLVQCREEALALARPGTRLHAKYLNNLANAYGERAEATGDQNDLDRSVEVSEQAVAARPQGSPGYAGALRNLGSHLRGRYDALGGVADLERSVDLAEQALSLCRRGGREWLAVANNLAGNLRARFIRQGAFDDLERSIALLQEAVALTPPTSPEASIRLGTLGNALRARYLRSRRMEDLTTTIAAYEQAVALAPADSPGDPTLLNNLGTALNDCYDIAGAAADLERAKECYAQAYQLAVPASVGRRTARNNQGRILLTQARRTESLPLTREAAGLLAEAISETPERTPDRLIYQLNLGAAQELEGRLARDDEAVRTALGTFRSVVTGSRGVAPEQGLLAARTWGAAATDRQWWEEAAQAYRTGLDVLEQLYQRQGRRDQKESWLQTAVEMAPRAAYALARAGDPRTAAVVAETGRAVLLTETLDRVSTDLDALVRDGHGELAAAYREATDALAAADRRLQEASASTGPARGHRSAVELRRAVDDAAERIRALHGYEGFRRPPMFADVAAAAQECPVVYLVPAKAGAVALVVLTSGSVEAVDLPQLAWDELARHVERYVTAYEAQHRDGPGWRSALLDVTRWLWPAVMGPVVQALAGAHRAVLVPMGWLGLLPLHVAWREDPQAPTGRRYALDDVLLTYAPNARSMTHARRVPPVSAQDGILVVADPAPIRASSLLHAEAEGRAARASFPSGRVLLGRQASRVAVWGQMAHWPILHFACHADADTAEPLDSCLLLAGDEEIRLADLIAADTFHPKVVVLSACETALIGTDLPDEVVNLPSGFLQAGARGVVGSFWPVYDDSTAVLMQRFYEIWRGTDQSRDPSVDPAPALRAAQQWLRDTPNATSRPATSGTATSGVVASGAAQDLRAGRDAGLEEPSAGDGPACDGRDHPVYWAAFCYVGA